MKFVVHAMKKNQCLKFKVAMFTKADFQVDKFFFNVLFSRIPDLFQNSRSEFFFSAFFTCGSSVCICS